MSNEKKDEPMVKYGVQFEDKVKVAEELGLTPVCPWCKGPLDSVDPPHCPKDGTKPFEKTR